MTGGSSYSKSNFNIREIKHIAFELGLKDDVIRRAAIESYKDQVVPLAMTGSNAENIKQLMAVFNLSEADCLKAIREKREELVKSARKRPHAKAHIEAQISAIDGLLNE